MGFHLSFVPKFWRGQIVPLAVFLRDKFNCGAESVQWHGLAQTLPFKADLYGTNSAGIVKCLYWALYQFNWLNLNSISLHCFSVSSLPNQYLFTEFQQWWQSAGHSCIIHVWRRWKRVCLLCPLNMFLLEALFQSSTTDISNLSFFRHPADAIYIRRVSDAETKPKWMLTVIKEYGSKSKRT